MGKKKIVNKGSTGKNNALKARVLAKSSQKKKKIESGILNVQSTYNNTRVSLTDTDGNLFFSSSSGSLGFRGAKKGTPFAAAKVAEVVAEMSQNAGLKSIHVVVKGVGAGRESAIRTFVSKGFEILSIKDVTPVPHNGPRMRKARRV